MRENEIERMSDTLVEDVRTRTNNANLNDLLGVVDGAGKSINGNLGDFQANTNLQSLLAVIGAGFEAANKDLHTLLYTEGAAYIGNVACPGAPVAGSILNVLVEGIFERTNTKTLEALLAVPDVAGHSVCGNIGDFMARTNLQSILAMLGLPDDINGSLYQRLGAYTAAAPLKTSVDQIETDTDPLVDGRVMYYSTTQDLNNIVGDYPLFTGATQAGVIEELIVIMPDAVAGGALTAISVQTDHTTPQVFITAAQGAVANLTAENQLFSNDPIYIGVGDVVNLSIVGGATGAGHVVTVIAKYRPIVSGGNLT